MMKKLKSLGYWFYIIRQWNFLYDLEDQKKRKKINYQKIDIELSYNKKWKSNVRFELNLKLHRFQLNYMKLFFALCANTATFSSLVCEPFRVAGYMASASEPSSAFCSPDISNLTLKVNSQQVFPDDGIDDTDFARLNCIMTGVDQQPPNYFQTEKVAIM